MVLDDFEQPAEHHSKMHRFPDQLQSFLRFLLPVIVSLTGLSCEPASQDSSKQSATTSASEPVESLLAFDPFDEVTDESSDDDKSFGWNGTWQIACDAGETAPKTVVAPSEFQFDVAIQSPQALELSAGMAIRRELSERVSLKKDGDFCISFLAQGTPVEKGQRGMLRVTLEPSDVARLAKNKCISFGFYGRGVAHVRDGDGTAVGRAKLPSQQTRLCVLRMLIRNECVTLLMKAFTPGEPVVDPQDHERLFSAKDWSTLIQSCWAQSDIVSIRIEVGDDASWRVKDLRIGPPWRSVTVPFQTTQ